MIPSTALRSSFSPEATCSTADALLSVIASPGRPARKPPAKTAAETMAPTALNRIALVMSAPIPDRFPRIVGCRPPSLFVLPGHFEVDDILRTKPARRASLQCLLSARRENLRI